jgi:UDP-3-O-[3-hydroxymyristoyl] N-acetylglucosamine deacetylase/3-hydroxyacyl-[acyl-carrier-protein] dehydratase
MVEKQKTIKNPVSISGVGLHTGKKATLTYQPAPENYGYKFQRTDLEGAPIINADINNVVDTKRGTTLEQNNARVNTVEHVLAAAAGLKIDNLLIEIDGPEMPIMDGSALPFIEALSEAGIELQQAERKCFDLKTTVQYINETGDSEIVAIPRNRYSVAVMVDFDSPVLGCQHATLNRINDFKTEIAASRTFVFLHELEELLNHDLIKGGDLDNAIVVIDKEVSKEVKDRLTKLFNKPGVKIGKQGLLNNVKLNYHNEPARHKLLDIVGDMALIGMPINAHIIASKPGHATNIGFARKMKQIINQQKMNNQGPLYDPNATPVYDINQIQEILPHRHPFLLIDKIIEISKTHVIGVKNVTMDEPYFRGHFPDRPIMPGVLQIEAMAQTGGILVLNTVPDPKNYLTYFLKIDKVKFKNMVVPGDTMIFKLDLITPIRRGICHMKGQAFVGNKMVMEGELMAQIVKKNNNEKKTVLKSTKRGNS